MIYTQFLGNVIEVHFKLKKNKYKYDKPIILVTDSIISNSNL